MKRIIFILAALLSVAVLSSFIFVDRSKEERSLKALWTEYQEASEQDRVRKMAEILEEIKKEALSERATWDYYRSCREYLDVRSRRNWKLRDSLQKQMCNEITAYDDPLLKYIWDRERLGADDLLKSVQEMKVRLAARQNRDVYEGVGGKLMYAAVRPLIDNDYEYALWDLFRMTAGGRGALRDEVYALLKEEIGDTYPKAGIAEYHYVKKVLQNPEERMRELAERYEGTALALLPLSSLLDIEFRRNEFTAGQEYFLELKGRLESYEHERQSYRTGADRLIAEDCTRFRNMLEHLESKAVFVTIKDGKAEFALRNLDKVRVRVSRDNDNVFETVLDNPVGSFYVLDTLAVELPALDDGDYTVRCYDGKNVIGKYHYPKYTLSMALRADKDGTGVYVADYRTGKPSDKVDVIIYKGDRKAAEAKDVKLDGFTPLPRDLAAVMDGDVYRIECRCMGDDGSVRSSRKQYVSGNREYDRSRTSEDRAVVMLDRSACRPGDTLKFKAVVYESFSDGTMRVAFAGKTVSVRLVDSGTNLLCEKSLETNEYGSIAGEFLLDGIRRNGFHYLDVRCGTRSMGRAELTIDEFVLPTFELTFDKQDKAFLPGDTVVVSGKLTSYSGHPLSSADVEAEVTLGRKVVMKRKLNVAEDGSFSLSFADVSDERSYSYGTKVRVTDITGETKSFSSRQYVMRKPVVRAELQNPAEGTFDRPSDRRNLGNLLSDGVGRVTMTAMYSYGEACKGLPLKYTLLKKDEAVLKGEALSGDTVDIDFTGLASGLYRLVVSLSLADSEGRKIEGKTELPIIKVRDTDTRLDADFENVFRVVSEAAPELQIGAGCGPVWAVVELFGDRGQRLKSDVLHLGKGEMRILKYDYKPEYPDAVVMNVLYFRESKCHTYTHTWTRPQMSHELPLRFVCFEDMSAPGASCSIALATEPGAEVLASVFDVATEQVRKNVWEEVAGKGPRVSYVRMSSAAGVNGNGTAMLGNYPYESEHDFDGLEVVVAGYGAVMRTKAAMDYVSVEEAADEEAIPFQLVGNDTADGVVVREDFSTTLAFEPFLRPSDDGTVNLDFKTSDKVSTFAVSVFAHDKSMNNKVIRREMLVILPVTVSVAQPQYLYEGDRYVLNVSLSNSTAEDVSGVVTLEGTVEGACEVTVPSGGSVPVSFDVEVPSGTDKMDFRVVFSSERCGDGVLVSVPVYPAAQELEEAHSAVLLSGVSEDEVINALRERFVNVSSVGAECSSVSVMDMLREALPLAVEAKGRDVVSLSEAMYVNLLAGGLRTAEGESVREYVEAAMAAASKILSCANADGGFGWFEGMRSSPVVTAVVLERYAGLRDRGLLDAVSEELGEDALDDFSEAVVRAVGYLDSVRFREADRPAWYGSVSLGQYLDVRAMYTGVPFDEAAARKAAGSEKYDEFRKAVKAFLVPKKGEGWTDGAVLSKVRMIRILHALEGSEQGTALAEAWGVASAGKIRRSMKNELESLKEYAVDHPSGGIYYPNAVLPFRGLLESEAYAHSMICDLYRDLASDERLGDGLAAMADGIRLWLMLQKEAQKWDSDPGFVEAMASVYDGSDAVKDTKVIVLSKRYVKPFNQIKAAGNGFKVTVEHYLEEASEGEAPVRRKISDGDVLHVGDRIVARYSVWSEENRSFVRLSVPRPACLRPEQQLSGWSGGFFRPLSYSFISVSPYAYREVKDARTLYWIDVFPEESSTIEEAFYVTQEGRFTSPAAEIESLYAPHYRANDSSPAAFVAVD